MVSVILSHKRRKIDKKIYWDKKFSSCGPKFLEGLRLDAYNEKLKLAFEFNGPHNDLHRSDRIMRAKRYRSPYISRKRLFILTCPNINIGKTIFVNRFWYMCGAQIIWRRAEFIGAEETMYSSKTLKKHFVESKIFLLL